LSAAQNSALRRWSSVSMNCHRRTPFLARNRTVHLAPRWAINGRGGRARTCGLLLPKVSITASHSVGKQPGYESISRHSAADPLLLPLYRVPHRKRDHTPRGWSAPTCIQPSAAQRTHRRRRRSPISSPRAEDHGCAIERLLRCRPCSGTASVFADLVASGMVNGGTPTGRSRLSNSTTRLETGGYHGSHLSESPTESVPARGSCLSLCTG